MTVAAGAPLRAERTRRDRLATPVTLGALAAAGTLVLALRSPHAAGSYGICPVLLVTGFRCAACGVLRATHDLAHLDVAGAWGMNPLWVLAVPVLVLLWTRWVTRAWRGTPARTSPLPGWLPVVATVLVVAYSVARNVVPALA